MLMNPCSLLILKFLATRIAISLELEAHHILDPEMKDLLYQPRHMVTDLSWNLEYLIDLCQQLNIKIQRAVFINKGNKATEAELKFMKEHEPLLYKIWAPKSLKVKDLRKFLADETLQDHRDGFIYNLMIILDISATSQKTLKAIEDKIKNLIERFLTETELQGEYHQNLYTYKYQKANFLKHLPRLYDELGANFKLLNIEHARLMGEQLLKTRFLETILGLELEGYLKVTSVGLQYLKTDQKNKQIQVLVLGVELNPAKIQSAENGQETTDSETPKTPPFGWTLTVKDNKGHILKDNEIVFTFPTTWSEKFRYFEYLWNHYSQHVDYKELYEYKSNLKYPESGSRWEINKRVRDEISKLRNDPDFKKLPITIATEKGFKLSIS